MDLPNDIYAPAMQNRAGAKRILIITADKTEDLEFFYPYYRFTEAGYDVDVATPDGGEFKGKNGLGLKQSKKISEVSAGDYAMLYIPGGKAPEKLKNSAEAVALTKAFVSDGKPVAAICHGPQLLAKADVIKNRRIAAWPEVEGEISAAGGLFVNEETVVDGNFVTARWPADLPAHTKKTLEIIEKGIKPRMAA